MGGGWGRGGGGESESLADLGFRVQGLGFLLGAFGFFGILGFLGFWGVGVLGFWGFGVLGFGGLGVSSLWWPQQGVRGLSWLRQRWRSRSCPASWPLHPVVLRVLGFRV